MADRIHTVHLHLRAPVKPAVGAVCNGCGICCAVEPCPVGQVLSRRRSGRCVALVWDERAVRYQCGALPVGSDKWYVRLKRALLLRWIAAGAGCDSTLQPELPTSATMGGSDVRSFHEPSRQFPND